MKMFKSIFYASVLLCSIAILGSGTPEKPALMPKKDADMAMLKQNLKQQFYDLELLGKQSENLSIDSNPKAIYAMTKAMNDIEDQLLTGLSKLPASHAKEQLVDSITEHRADGGLCCVILSEKNKIKQQEQKAKDKETQDQK